MVGKQFGRLTVVCLVGTDKRHNRIWECECTCGNIVRVRTSRLMAGETKSCGCYSRDASSARRKHGRYAGGYRDPLTVVYGSMCARCYNPNSKDFKYYGARGITICPEWRASSANFIEWAQNSGYTAGLYIDRIDNSAGYSPHNCRWVTRSENMRNTRANHFVQIGNDTKTIAEWAEISGINRQTLWNRIKRNWAPRDLLNPVAGRSLQRGRIANQ